MIFLSESELVSGFKTEYGASGFSLIFMAEYGSILFMSVLFSLLFFSSSAGSSLIMKSMLITFWFIWVLTTVPRYRYDKLMNLAWVSFLPVSLFMLMFCYLIGIMLMLHVQFM